MRRFELNQRQALGYVLGKDSAPLRDFQAFPPAGTRFSTQAFFYATLGQDFV